MSRIARKNIVSKFVHIVAKGIKNEFIFYKQEYKEKYTSLLNKSIKELEGIDLIAYCIMDNHAHLLIHTEKINNIEKLMRKINTAYAIFYNLQEERAGYVFLNRYHSEIIENGIHLLSCIKYIHENPVKAGIVEKEQFYQYSSCRAFLEDKMSNDILYSVFGENFKYAYTDVDKKIEYHFIDEDERVEKIERKGIEIIIEEFCNKYNTSIAEIRKSNSLIIEFKSFLMVKYKISNKNICAILGIGKNRISQIEKKLK